MWCFVGHTGVGYLGAWPDALETQVLLEQQPVLCRLQTPALGDLFYNSPAMAVLVGIHRQITDFENGLIRISWMHDCGLMTSIITPILQSVFPVRYGS